jgi:hypothetical protein
MCCCLTRDRPAVFRWPAWAVRHRCCPRRHFAKARCRTHRWPSTGSPLWSRSARPAGCGGCCSRLTPDGCAENLVRLGQDPAGIEAIVCSHGHFDHTTGLSGLVGRLGPASLSVLIHPEFWNRRRLAIPGGEPFELPTTSRRALEGVGFDIIGRRQPSFLFDRSVLITGEVDRVTGFEKGFAIHQAWRGTSWEPTKGEAGALGECGVWGARLTDGRCPPESWWTAMRSSRRPARTLPAAS